MHSLKKIYVVSDSKTHRLIGLFDDEHAGKFFTGADVLAGNKLFENGIKFAKDGYKIWELELNGELTDSRLRISKARITKKKEVS
jgi:hypothetical protein